VKRGAATARSGNVPERAREAGGHTCLRVVVSRQHGRVGSRQYSRFRRSFELACYHPLMPRRTPAALFALVLLPFCGALLRSQQGAGAQGGGAGRSQPTNAANAIVGRVLDPSGKPVPGTFVTALRPEPSGGPGGRPFSFVSALLHTMTNERGEFRLDGLSFGEFYVVAMPHNAPTGLDGRVNRSGYAISFFPGVTKIEEAKRVAVSVVGPAPADIVLVPVRLATIAGTVIGSTGQPIAGRPVALTHGDGLFGLDSQGLSVRPDGRFLIAGVPPGTYFLLYYAEPLQRGVIPKVSRAEVAVAGADIANVRVLPLDMVRATGRAVIDPAARSSLQPSTIHVSAFPFPADGNPGAQQAGDLKEDLTFEFRTWPGIGRIRVAIQPAIWTLKAVRRNGVDVTGKDIDFVQGTEISGLEVELVKRR
jgi:hypothetical protein